MKKAIFLMTLIALAYACGSSATNKYAEAMEEIVLVNAPGADKSVYNFRVLEMTGLPDITLDSLKRLRPLLDLPDDAPATIKVLRTQYQLTEPRSGNTIKERFDFYMTPDGSKCYLKIVVRN